MAPTSVFLPGKSPGQRSPAGYSPWGCKRVRHDLATKQQQPYYVRGLERQQTKTLWGTQMTESDKPGRQYNSGHSWGLPEQSPGGAYLVINETFPDTWASQEKCERVGADILGQRSRIPMLSKASSYGSREGGIVVYTLLYLKWTTNSDLLYSAWNSAQCYMAAWIQGSLGRMYTHIYMAEFLCCPPETITTLLIDYACVGEYALRRFGCVQLCVTLWTVAHQAPLSMGFSKQ